MGRPSPSKRSWNAALNALMRDLARATEFERFNANGELVPCDPPQKIVHMLKEEGRSRLPILRGIISAPTLRADASILQDAGFDERTGLLYDPEGVEFPRLPDYPTKEEGRAALDKILHVFRGFPFEGKPGRESPSRSVAVACTLTALVRQSLVRAPGFAFDAPVPRTGKSKCIDIAHAIAWGHHAAVNNWTGDRKEDEKLLGAVALSGCAALAIDNIGCYRRGAPLRNPDPAFHQSSHPWLEPTAYGRNGVSGYVQRQ
jgi:putative DNA primase/helicase